MAGPTLEDYRWLVSDESQRYLSEAVADEVPLVRKAKKLRKVLSASRTHLVLEQIELRERAKNKFSQAERMFFTRRSLEQATEEAIANYKAQRFPAEQPLGSWPLADLCSGIGGDLIALAARGPCIGVERDPIVALLADANCRNLGLRHARIERTDAHEIADNLRCTAWHIDPDRRTTASRTSHIEFSEPGVEVLAALARSSRNGAVKLAPAAKLPNEIAEQAELEWIGSRGECRQQVAWLGELATRMGARRATVINQHGRPHSFSGLPNAECLITQPARYLFDVPSTVAAARLSNALANEFGLSALSRPPTYFTSDHIPETGLLDRFEVDEVLPLDRKRLKSALRQRRIGSLEIKVRGASVEPEQLRSQLQLQGGNTATLLIGYVGSAIRAILAQRL